MPEPTSTAWLLKDWLSLVGTIVGFAGVCLTLIFNAWVAGKRREAELAQDANTIRVSLLSELKVVREYLQQHVSFLDKQANGDSPYLPTAAPDMDGLSRAYRAALPKIGLLSELQATEVVRAYAKCESAFKATQEFYEKSAKFDNDLKRETIRMTAGFLKGRLAAVDDAIRALDLSPLQISKHGFNQSQKPSGVGLNQTPAPELAKQ